jgi:lipid II:glycine glycyltransferase (peptidoglycan interpeptide bridge formation enzyme)
MHIDDHIDLNEWDQFVATHPDGHVFQTSGWSDLKSAFGWHGERIAIRRAGTIVAGAQVLFRRLPLGPLAYVPKGPLVDYQDEVTSRRLVDAVHQLCRTRGAFTCKMEPDLTESAELSTWFARHGLHAGQQTIQPRRTILIDISASEDAILKRMKSKTRYNIRLAKRKGIQVHSGNRQELDAFNQLMAVTGKRDSFGVRSSAYYERAYDILCSTDQGRLFLATFEDQPVAGLLALACGQKAWYIAGASGNEHREKMPSYALQWAAIRWASARGCTTYDLCGVPDEDEETLEAGFTERNDGLWGVYRFKRGFGGQLVRYAGAFDYIYNKPLYWAYHLALRLLS